MSTNTNFLRSQKSSSTKNRLDYVSRAKAKRKMLIGRGVSVRVGRSSDLLAAHRLLYRKALGFKNELSSSEWQHLEELFKFVFSRLREGSFESLTVADEALDVIRSSLDRIDRLKKFKRTHSVFELR
jgi:hypothetical protein